MSSAIIVALIAGGLVAVPSSSLAAAVVGGGAVNSDRLTLSDEPLLIPDATTATTSTYQQPDGSYEFQAFSTPVNFVNEAGAWQAIDNSFVDAPGAAYEVVNASNSYEAKIPSDASTTPVKFTTADGWVSMRLHGADQSPDVVGSIASFDDVTRAASVTYKATGDGLKEDIVLTAAPNADARPLAYTYTLDSSPGLTPDLATDGGIEFKNSAGAALIEIPAGTMNDSAKPQAVSSNVEYKLAEIDGAWLLTVTPDATWLGDPTRVYPVSIDPSLTGKAATPDCWIRSSVPNQNACGFSSTYLKVGRSDASSTYRALLDFNVASIPANATVTSATMSLNLASGQTLNPNLSATYSVFAATKKFDSAATWNSAGASGAWATPGGDFAGTAYSSITTTGANNTAGYKDFTGLGSLIQGWVSGTIAHKGIVLKQAPENVNNVISFFSSSSASGNDGKRPGLTVVYTVPPPAATCDVVLDGDNPPAEPDSFATLEQFMAYEEMIDTACWTYATAEKCSTSDTAFVSEGCPTEAEAYGTSNTYTGQAWEDDRTCVDCSGGGMPWGGVLAGPALAMAAAAGAITWPDEPRFGDFLTGVVSAALLSLSQIKAKAEELTVPWPNIESTTAKKWANEKYKVYEIYALKVNGHGFRTYKYGITRRDGDVRLREQDGKCEAHFTEVDGAPVDCKDLYVAEDVDGWYAARVIEGTLALRYKIAHDGKCPPGMLRCL